MCYCVKSVQIRSYFWSVFSYIRTEYRKIRTRNNSVLGPFSRSVPFRLYVPLRFNAEINIEAPLLQRDMFCEEPSKTYIGR